MKRTLAHGMRRTARALIKWSNKLEPHFEHLHKAMDAAGQAAGKRMVAEMRVDKARRDLARAEAAAAEARDR